MVGEWPSPRGIQRETCGELGGIGERRSSRFWATIPKTWLKRSDLISHGSRLFEMPRLNRVDVKVARQEDVTVRGKHKASHALPTPGVCVEQRPSKAGV